VRKEGKGVNWSDYASRRIYIINVLSLRPEKVKKLNRVE